MPNLDFYAARPDLEAVVDFVMMSAGCEVFESYSVPGSPLRRFHRKEQILEAFDRSAFQELGLVLFAATARGSYRIERFQLVSPEYSKAPWRERILGWGLIHLELHGVRGGQLRHCHTNHNSEARARKWEASCPGLPPLAEWDFREVSRVSGRLNRHVREKLAIARLGSRPILRAAKTLLEAGQLVLEP
jgi:hypothetical protein